MNGFSRLLIDEYPLMVLPNLATSIGLNEAIILQQLHYWINSPSNKNIHDGRKWTYDSLPEWQKKNFPFWSTSTIKRTVNSLKKQNLILVANYNRAGFDKTNWYSIDYEELNRVTQRWGQNDPTKRSNWTDGVGQNDPTYTRDLPETYSETSSNMSSSDEHDHTDAKNIIDYLNEISGKHFRHTATNYRLIESRLKDYSMDDIKQVIKNKTNQWYKTPYFKYVQPKTLFRASNFEGYVNEQPDNEQIGGNEEYGEHF